MAIGFHYLTAVVLAGLAILVRWLLDPWLGPDQPFSLLYVAVALAAWLGGYRPALLAAILGYVACDWLFIEPRGGFQIVGVPGVIRLGIYALATGLIITLAGSMRNGRQRDRRERAAGDAARRVSEERFRRLVETANEGIWEVDAEARTTYVNRRMADMLGYPPEAMMTMTAFDLVHPDDLGRATTSWEERLHDRPEEAEWRLRRADGTYAWVQSSSVPIKDSEGRVAGAFAMVTDVTDRKRAEERLAAVVSSIDDHLVSYDRAWRYTYVNDGAARMIGKTREELLGRSIWDLFPAAVGNQYYRELHQAVEHHEVIRSEHYYRPFDRWFENYIYPTSDGVTVFASDVTSRKQAEINARAAEERLRLIIDNVPALIAYIDHDFRYRLSNHAYETWFGLKPDAIHLGRVPDVLGERAWEKLRPRMEAALAGQVMRFEDEVTYRDGRTRWIDASYVPHVGADGTVEGFAVLVNDITARKRAQQELERTTEQLRLAEAAQRLIVSLHDATRAMHDPADVMLEIVTRVGRHFEVARCSYGEIDPERGHATVSREYGETGPPMLGRHRLDAFGSGIIDDLRAGRTLIVSDTERDPRTAGPDSRSLYETNQIRSVLCVPLVKDERLVAALALAHREPRHWSPAEARLLEQVAERTWFAVESARAAAALRESRDVLALAMRAGRMGAWSRNLATDAVWWTPELEEIVALPPGGFAGDMGGFFELVHPDDRPGVSTAVETAIVSGEDYAVEFRFRHGSGEWRWMEGRGRAAYDADGTPVMLYGLGIDITERKRAETAVRESEQKHRILAEGLPLLVAVSNPEGQIEYCNARMLEFTGLDLDRLNRGESAELVHPDDLETARRQSAEGVRRGEPFDQEYRIRSATGTEHRWFLVRVTPLRSRDGAIVRWVTAALDVDDRKRAEDALRDSEERFRMIADNMAPLAWTADRLGWATWYNQRWYEYTGTTFEEMRDRGWERLHHPDHLERVRQTLQACLERGEPWEDTFPLRGKDGGYRWFLSRSVPIRGAAGEIIRWFGTNIDVTERVEMEQTLREADRRKDEFIATLAHELRNPLAPIRNAVEIIRLTASADPKLAGARDVIARQVQQMTRLVDELLEVSRITQGKVQLRKARIELAQVVADAVEAARPLIEASAHVLTVTLPDQRILLEADATRLTQVLLNLLNNAAKYTPKGGHVWLSARPEDGQVAISVRDTGIGIPPRALPTIFEMFSQVTPALERSEGGLGIGLALVRGLVELHGGRVEARSGGLGKGSEFVVRLPLADGGHDAALGAALDGRAQRGARRRVLVVDDNRDAADSLGTLLGLMGHDVLTAHDGLEAVQAAATFRPDAVLLDIGLPKMNGYDAARQIRQETWGRRIKLIALTGWGQEDDKRRASEAGFDLHLTKPVDPARLGAVLEAEDREA